MEAVIIAAGKGSRMNRLFSPKPLTPLLVAKLAGIQRFNVVVGYKAAAIKQAVGDGRTYGVRINYSEQVPLSGMINDT
jgi:dTDP-glucose pyrophosphorylase